MKIEPFVLDLKNALPLPESQELARMWIVKGFFYAFIMNHYETYKKDLSNKILDIARRHGIPYKTGKPEDQVNFLRTVIGKMITFSVAQSGAEVNKYFRIRRSLDGTDLHSISNQDFINFTSVQAANFIYESFKAPPVIVEEIEVRGIKAIEGKNLREALIRLIDMHSQFDYFYQAALQCTILDPTTNNVQNLVDYIVETNLGAYIFDGIYGYELFVRSLFSLRGRYKEAKELMDKRIERLMAGRDKRMQEAYRQSVREANYELRRLAESAISTVTSPIKSALESHPLGRIMLNMASFGFRQFYLRTNKLFGLGGKRSSGYFDEGGTYYDPLGGVYKAKTRQDAKMMNQLKKAWDIIHRHVPDKRKAQALVKEYVELNAKYFSNPKELQIKIPELIQKYAPDSAENNNKMKQLVNALHAIFVYKSKLAGRSMTDSIFDSFDEEDEKDTVDSDISYVRSALGLRKYRPDEDTEVGTDFFEAGGYSSIPSSSGAVTSIPTRTGADAGLRKVQDEGLDIITELSHAQQPQQPSAQTAPQQKKTIQTPAIKGASRSARPQPAQASAPIVSQPPRGYTQLPQSPTTGLDIVKALYETLGSLLNQQTQQQTTSQNNIVHNVTTNFFSYPQPTTKEKEEVEKEKVEIKQERERKREEEEAKKAQKEKEKKEEREKRQKEREQILKKIEEQRRKRQALADIRKQKSQSRLPSKLPKIDQAQLAQPKKKIRRKFLPESEAAEAAYKPKRGSLLRRILGKSKDFESEQTIKDSKAGRGISKAAKAIRSVGKRVAGGAGAGFRALRGIGTAARAGMTAARVAGIASSLSGLGGGAGVLGAASSILGPILAGVGLIVGATGAFGIGKALYKGFFKQVTGQKTFEFVGRRGQDTPKQDTSLDKKSDIDVDKVDKDKIPTISSIKSGTFKLPSVTSSGQQFVSALKQSTGYTYGTTQGAIGANLTDTTVKTQVKATQPLPTDAPIRPMDYDESLRREPTQTQASAAAASEQTKKTAGESSQQDSSKQIAATANQAALQHMAAQAQLNAAMAQNIEELTNRLQQLQARTADDLAGQMRA